MVPLSVSNFLKQYGISLLDEFGVNDYVLSLKSSFILLELVQKEKIPIVGGDVYLKNENNKLILGDYYWLFWSCNRKQNETFDSKSYYERSIEMAKKQLVKVDKTARKENVSLYINFVF